MSNNLTTSNDLDDFVSYADMGFQVFAAQISANYLKFIKAKVVPALGKYSNVPLRELRTIMVISHSSEPTPSSIIAKILHYDPATVSRSTRWLVKNGLISSQDCSRDARSTVYDLTPKGTELSALYWDTSRQFIAELNAEDPGHPSRQDIEDALGVLEAVRDRSRRAAEFAGT